MSLTTGIHRCKKATPLGPILEDVSWKNRTFDMWITEYLFLYSQSSPSVLQINDDDMKEFYSEEQHEEWLRRVRQRFYGED